jgi:hypothetical protein
MFKQQATQITANTQNRITATDNGGIIPFVSISLKVQDGSGEPAINASIREKGNDENYAVTDFDGNVTLENVNSYNTVVINYQGQEKAFKAMEVPNVVQFDVTQLDTVFIEPKKKSYAWLGWLAGIAIVGVVAKAISEDKKPLKVSL